MISFGEGVRIEWGTMIFQAVIFLVLLLIVRKYAMGPAMSVMEKRQQHIEEQISAAEDKRKEAEALLEKQREEFNQSREEAKLMIERAKKQSQTEASEILESAQERAERTMKEAREEIEREKVKAIASLRDEVGHLSVMLASRIMEKELNEQQHEQEIEQFIKQVGDRL